MKVMARAAAVLAAALFACGWLWCQAGELVDLESIIWPDPRPHPDGMIGRWLSLPDSQICDWTLGLKEKPLYLKHSSSLGPSGASITSPSAEFLWRWQRGGWIRGFAFRETREILDLELKSDAANRVTAGWGTDAGGLSYFQQKEISSRWRLSGTVGGGIGYANGLGNPWWAGFGIKSGDEWIVSFEHREDCQYLNFGYFYQNEFFDLPLNYRLAGDRVNLYGRLLERFDLSAKYESYGLRSTRRKNEIPDREFFPRGVFSTQEYRLGVKTVHDYRLYLYHRQDFLHSQAYVYDQSLSFGKVTRGDLFYSHLSASCQMPIIPRMPITASFGYFTVSGHLKGHLELWPFTPTLVDLLGLRRYFDGKANFLVRTAQIQMDHHPAPPLKLNYGLTVAQVIPRASFTDWRPLFLVFGKTDENYSEMDVMEAWIGGVSLGVEYTYRRWQASLLARQLFPIQVKRPGGGGPAAPGPRDRIYGGGFFTFSIRYLLPTAL